ncbi:ribonuclease H-like domain-containing protein [Tanacetum coccineum]
MDCSFLRWLDAYLTLSACEQSRATDSGRMNGVWEFGLGGRKHLEYLGGILGEYDMWKLRIEQYFQVQDYALWDVIENGNSFKPAAQTTTNAEGTSTTLIPGPVTADEKIQKKNDVKARSMLLMALPNEHLLTFNQYKDAKTLFAAIQTRFGGNDATKKTQKTLLKQMYENFSAPSTESLDSIFNRLQKIVSQLAILGENISQEDLNLKFLRSLPSEWNTHVVVWRNKPDLDTMSFDDLYNNFKIIEQEVKETASSSSQNVAFVSSSSSTNEVNTAYGVSTTNTQVSPANTQVSPASTQVSTASTQVSTTNLSDATVYAFLANQPNGSQLVHEDLEQIHEDDLEEMDLKWQYDKSKVECFNCHKFGHFAMECKGPRNQDNKSRNQHSSRRTINVEETSSKAMLAIDGAGFDWSFMADEEVPTDMAPMAFSDSEFNKSEFNLATYKRRLASVEEQLVFFKKNEVLFCEQLAVLKRDISYKDSEIIVLKHKLIESQITDKSRKGVGFISYNAIPPPPIGLFSPQNLDLSNSVLEEFQQPAFKGYGPKTSKSVSEDTSNEINFVRPQQQEKPVRKPVKYAEMYRLIAITIKGKGWYLGILIQGSKESLILSVAKATIDESIAYGHRTARESNTKPLIIAEFIRVFFLATKNETSGILKSFITEIENLVDKKVKIIRCDNGTEFKNRVMSEFCKKKGIKKEFSIARTLQQNGVVESLNINTVSLTVTTAPFEATHADFFVWCIDKENDKDYNMKQGFISAVYEGISLMKTFILIEAIQEELLQFKLQQVWTLVDLTHGKRAIGIKWVYRNKKDERGIMIRNKARLVAQGYAQEEGIDYDEVFAPVARIKAIRLFLAYDSFKDFVVYQIDVKCDFYIGKIERKVYVCSTRGLQVTQKDDGIFISQDKLISWQCKKQTVVANSTTEVEYVADASCCGQFWETATVITLNNGEIELTATIDGKDKIVTEASVTRHLQLVDSNGISSLPTTEIFEQLSLMGAQLFRVRKIDEIDQDPEISLVQHDAELQGRYGQDMEFDLDVSTAEPVSTAGAAVTTASVAVVSTASPTRRVSTADDITMAEILMYIRKSASKDKAVVRLQAELEEEERQRIAMLKVSKRDAEEELDQESSKRQKTGESSELAEEPRDKEADELSQEELQQMMIIVPEQGMNVEALQTKYLIIDWEIYIEAGLGVLDDHRAGNQYRDADDELWKLQKHIYDLTWKLYDSCGVHHVSTEKEIDIYMLVEKEYPLLRGTLTLMLVAKLLVEQDNEMSRELLRKTFINQATIQDGRVIVQQVQGDKVKVILELGEGHMVRQCSQPKRPRNAAWYKDKAMLAEAQEAGQILDEEQLVFLIDPGVLDGQAVQTIILNNAAFQTEDLDTYDSDCDDISNAKAVLMANISNYGSDVISEAQQDSMILSVIEQMSEQMINHVNNWEKANKEQNNESVTVELERKAKRIKPTLYDGIVMSVKHVAMLVSDDEETLILEEESRLNISKKEKDPEAIKQNISHKPTDYEKLNRLSDDFGKRFTPQQELLAEQAFWLHMSNPTSKPSDASLVKIEAPKELPKVSLVNERLKKLKFHLARFDNVVKIRTTPDARTKGEWGFEHTKAVFNNEIIPFLKSLKDIFNVFDRDLLNEIMEVFKEQFDSIKKARVRTKEHSDSLIDKLNLKSAENKDLKAQIQDKVQADILWGIVEQAKAKQPLDKELDFVCKHAQRIQELLIYVQDTCLNAIKLNEKKVAVMPKNKVKKVRIEVFYYVVEPIRDVDVKHSLLNENSEPICATCRTFTIVGNSCPLTRITSANVVPPKKTTSDSVETQKPELKVYRRKPKNVKNVGSSKKAKIVESKNANHSEPNHTWGSNATDIPSSSSLVMIGCLDCSLLDSGTTMLPVMALSVIISWEI